MNGRRSKALRRMDGQAGNVGEPFVVTFRPDPPLARWGFRRWVARTTRGAIDRYRRENS